MTQQELQELDAREVPYRPSDGELIGVVFAPYGDYRYYRLSDASYVKTYYSIGD